jgi:PAS domain S-box-containing protein
VVESDASGPTRMIGVNYDVTDRARAEEALRESEARLRALIDSSVAFIAVLDGEGRVTEVNAPFLRMGGVTRPEVIGLPLWEAPWWCRSPEAADRLRNALARVGDGECMAFEEDLCMDGDMRMSVHLGLHPAFDAEGRLVEIVLSAVDITSRKQAEDHVRHLLRELAHRSKNTFGLVRAVAQLTQRSDPADFFRKFEERLLALSAAQDLLVSEDAASGVRLCDLVRSQLAHFRSLFGTRIQMDGPVIRMGPRAAQALGMALHELGTNAAKYGALSNESGRVAVTWHVEGNRFEIMWTESGGPAVAGSERRGFGSIVLGALTRETLDAAADIEMTPLGLRWRMSCDRAALRDVERAA